MESSLINKDRLELIESFYSQTDCELLFQSLMDDIQFESHQIKIFGKLITEPRLVAYFGEKDYTYSQTKLPAKPWPKVVKRLKNEIETYTQFSFNSVLINLYRNGNDYMGWHSDDEKELGEFPSIASLSFGATRSFELRSKFDKEKPIHKIPLHSGTLLIMKGDLQHFWKHRIAPTKKITHPRINLTFRNIIF